MYRGKVTQVDSSGVWVTTADFGLLGPCQAVVANYAVNDMVLCVNVGEAASPELVVVGHLTATGSAAPTSTDNTVPRFNGTGGALQGSGVTIDDSNRINTSGVSGSSNYVFVQATNNSSIMWNRAAGASGNFAYQIWQTRTGEADENETHTGLSYDGSLYLTQKKVGGSSVNRDIWSIRPDGKFRLVFCGATGGFELGTAGPRIMAGSGAPENVVTAPVGSLWLRTNGGAGTTMYLKESGTGNTGWVAK